MNFHDMVRKINSESVAIIVFMDATTNIGREIHQIDTIISLHDWTMDWTDSQTTQLAKLFVYCGQSLTSKTSVHSQLLLLKENSNHFHNNALVMVLVFLLLVEIFDQFKILLEFVINYCNLNSLSEPKMRKCTNVCSVKSVPHGQVNLDGNRKSGVTIHPSQCEVCATSSKSVILVSISKLILNCIFGPSFRLRFHGGELRLETTLGFFLQIDLCSQYERINYRAYNSV